MDKWSNSYHFGKVNYYMTIIKAIKANEEHGQESRSRTKMEYYLAKDGYKRKRLHVAFIHKHPNQKEIFKKNHGIPLFN
jgi:RNA-directed DNA polymerase